MDAELVYISSSGKERVFPILKDVVTVGRKPGCDLQVPLQQVSREHCQFLVEEGDLIVRDLNSANGTYVNGKRVEQQEVLEPGDRVTIGNITLTVRIDGEPERITKEPAAAGAAMGKSPEKDQPTPELPIAGESELELQLSGTGDAASNFEEDILGESFFAELEDEEE